MTAARARVLPLHRDRADTDPRLVELGWLAVNARILTGEIAGERDVRLQAWRDADAVTVELLWCCPDEPAPVYADAVRIVDGESVVWRSMDGRCAAAELVRFLCDLLLLDEDSRPVLPAIQHQASRPGGMITVVCSVSSIQLLCHDGPVAVPEPSPTGMGSDSASLVDGRP